MWTAVKNIMSWIRRIIKKAILTLFISTSLLTSCGQQNIVTEIDSRNALTNDISLLKAEDSWKEVVPGGYLRITESRRQIVAFTLEGFKWALQEEQKQALQEQRINALNISKQEGSRDKAIAFLNNAIKQWDSNFSAQKTAVIYPCTVAASAMGGASTSAAKAYANTSCSESRQQGSSTTVSTSRGNSYGNDMNNDSRLSSKASAYLDGPGPCNSFASAGIVNQGYVSDSYGQCYGSNGN